MGNIDCDRPSRYCLLKGTTDERIISPVPREANKQIAANGPMAPVRTDRAAAATHLLIRNSGPIRLYFMVTLFSAGDRTAATERQLVSRRRGIACRDSWVVPSVATNGQALAAFQGSRPSHNVHHRGPNCTVPSSPVACPHGANGFAVSENWQKVCVAVLLRTSPTPSPTAPLRQGKCLAGVLPSPA